MAGTISKLTWGPGASASIGGDVGYTRGPCAVSWDWEVAWMDVDQEQVYVDAQYTLRDPIISVVLAEITLANLAAALGMTSGSIIGASGIAGGVPSGKSVNFTCEAAEATTRTYALSNAVPFDASEIAYEKGKPAALSIKFRYVKTAVSTATVVEA